MHTHCRNCSVFAASERDVPIDSDDEQMIDRFENPVRTAVYALPGSDALWQNTIEALSENSGCLMAHHGMLCTGDSLEEAFENCCMLETYCSEYIAGRYKSPVYSRADGTFVPEDKFCKAGETLQDWDSRTGKKNALLQRRKRKKKLRKLLPIL